MKKSLEISLTYILYSNKIQTKVVRQPNNLESILNLHYDSPGIPSYLRGIKYPGIFRSYHPENTPHSSRILRQLVRTNTCMGFNGISESFFHLKTPYEALFVHNVLLYCNKYLFIPTLYGNLKFHNYSIHTIPNTAGSESFTESHPILRKDTEFATNINLWQFSVLNRSNNSTLTRFIIKLAYNNYKFLSFINSCFQDYYRVLLKSYQREAVSKKFTAKVLPTENLDRW